MKTALRLIGFLKPFWKWVLLSILLSTATIVSGIGLLGTSAYLIAYAALQPSVAVLQVAIVGVRFFGITRSGFRYLERLTSHSVNFRLLAGLRTWFYRALEPLAPARLTDLAGGDLLQRALGDIETLENFYVRVVSPGVTAVLITLGMGWFAGRFRPILGVILAAGLALGGTAVPLLAYRIGKGAGSRLVRARASMNARLLESFQGLGDLAAFGQVGTARQNIESDTNRLSAVQLEFALGSSAVSFLEQVVSGGTLIVMLWFAVPFVTAGQIDGITLAVLALLTMASFEAVTPLPLAAQLLESSLAAARRLFDLASLTPAVIEPAKPVPLPVPVNRVRLERVSMRYDAALPLTLKEISLELAAGKLVAVVGSSGAGKSSLANLLLRFWNFEGGEYMLDQVPAGAALSDDVRACFSVISSNAYLFNTTVRANLHLARPGAPDEALVEALRLAGMSAWFEGLPRGLSTWVGEHGLHLSGGESQRLAIARMILQDRPFVVLDEPTANLDAQTELKLIEDLADLFQDKGVLWITHHLVRMERMDEILVMDQGRVAERGTHDQLMALGGLYRRLWKLDNLFGVVE